MCGQWKLLYPVQGVIEKIFGGGWGGGGGGGEGRGGGGGGGGDRAPGLAKSSN